MFRGRLKMSALVSFSSAPLQIAPVIGILGIILSLCLGILGIVLKLQTGHVQEWLIILCPIIFLSSIQLLSLGIIGLYLTNIFEETKKRPNYIIDSMHGFSPDIEKKFLDETL